ncbi:hypothetical protein [Rhizobium phaseoli]|nr:hypothetical protein [Rhizobium phaseoli]
MVAVNRTSVSSVLELRRTISHAAVAALELLRDGARFFWWSGK